MKRQLVNIVAIFIEIIHKIFRIIISEKFFNDQNSFHIAKKLNDSDIKSCYIYFVDIWPITK